MTSRRGVTEKRASRKGRETMQKIKKEFENEQRKQMIVTADGPLYPLHPFGNDYYLLVSIAFGLLFCIPQFRALKIAAPVKLIPIGTLSYFIYTKKEAAPSLENKLTVLAASFLFHAIGDSYLHQDHHGHLFSSSLAFGTGWILYIILVLSELSPEAKMWRNISGMKKFFVLLASAYAVSVVYYLMKRLNTSTDYWPFLMIPYAIAEVGALCSGIITGQAYIIIGSVLYIFSDSVIAIKSLTTSDLSLVTWPAYFIGQWFLLAGGLKWLQMTNPFSKGGPNPFEMMGFDFASESVQGAAATDKKDKDFDMEFDMDDNFDDDSE